MPRIFECPNCKQDISDSYESDDPSVGIIGGWYCDACDEGFTDEDGPELSDDDVQLFRTDAKQDNTNRCPKCLSTQLEMGYGLAGGGIGPYSYCPNCGIIVNKLQDI